VETIESHLRAIIIDFHPMSGDWVKKAEKIISGILRKGFKTIIKPDFSCGWTQAGSWLRIVKAKTDNCEELMNGFFCCGCGKKIITKRKRKALCSNCHVIWGKKFNKGFDVEE